MVGKEDEVGLQRLPVALLRLLAEELVEVVLGGIEIGSALDRLLPLAEAEEGGEDGREAGGERDRLALIRLLVEEIGHGSAEHRDAGAQCIHRWGLSRQGAQGGDDGVGQGAVRPELGIELVQLRLRRQPAVPEQVGNLLEGGFAGQLVDVVAAVDEASLVAVDVAERGRGGDDAF